MSITPELYLAASQLINHEANCLDRRQWNEWLGLYTEDCVYWVPSWKNEEETVSDPEVSLNLMYLKGRESLGDRVYRIESRDSFASVPLDRTSHVVGTLH
ncbi:MAG: aromatic-ring-hydroxylating dioxygenase subunit beta, partial [Aquisalimonadaceae bacterium]